MFHAYLLEKTPEFGDETVQKPKQSTNATAIQVTIRLPRPVCLKECALTTIRINWNLIVQIG